MTPFALFIWNLGEGAIGSRMLAASGITTKALVINEKNFFGNSPVSRSFAYSYQFTVAGKKYTGNTRDSRCRIGDTVIIKYVPDNPNFSTMLDAK